MFSSRTARDRVPVVRPGDAAHDRGHPGIHHLQRRSELGRFGHLREMVTFSTQHGIVHAHTKRDRASASSLRTARSVVAVDGSPSNDAYGSSFR